MINPFKLAAGSLRDYFKDGGMMFSAALSYYAIVAIVPFFIFTFAVLGRLMGTHVNFFDFSTTTLMEMFPSITQGIAEEMRNLMNHKGIGNLSLALFAVISFQFYSAMHKSMEAVFKVEQKRSFIGMLFLSVVVVTLLIVLMFVSFSLTSLVPFLKPLSNYVPWLKTGIIKTALVRYVIPFVIVLFTALIVFMLVPKRAIKFAHALYGAIFTALMTEAAKHVFTWYIGSLTGLGAVYGSLSAFVVFLIWVYYSSAIFIIGAEIVHHLDENGNSASTKPLRKR